MPRRVVVLGVTGSGKTTAGRRIAAAIDALHIELDALYWDPNWTESEPAVFQERVRTAIAGADHWVTDGGYASHVVEITWVRADTIVWLDYPLRLSMWRLFRRSVRRIVRREELWAGNRETVRTQFFSRNSLFLWARTSHAKYKRAYPARLAQPELAHVRVLRFRRPPEFEAWVRALEGETQRHRGTEDRVGS